MDENALPPSTPPPPPPIAATPPPLLPPPPVIMAPGSLPPRRGRGWMVFAIILLVLLILSVFGNLSGMMGNLVSSRGKHLHSVGPRLEEVITEDNESSDKIAVIDVQGIITSRAIDSSGYSMVDLIKAQLKRAEEDKQVKAVILKVDSPGGEVLGTSQVKLEVLIVGISVFDVTFENHIVGHDQFSPTAATKADESD